MQTNSSTMKNPIYTDAGYQVIIEGVADSNYLVYTECNKCFESFQTLLHCDGNNQSLSIQHRSVKVSKCEYAYCGKCFTDLNQCMSCKASYTVSCGAVEDKSVGASGEGLTTKKGPFSMIEKVSTNNVNRAVSDGKKVYSAVSLLDYRMWNLIDEGVTVVPPPKEYEIRIEGVTVKFVSSSKDEIRKLGCADEYMSKKQFQPSNKKEVVTHNMVIAEKRGHDEKSHRIKGGSLSLDSSPTVTTGRCTYSDSFSAANCNATLKSNTEHSNSLNKLKTKLANITVPEKFKKEPIKHIFSPELNKECWTQQLEALKACNAEICDITMADFTTVDVIDLSNIGNCEVKTLTKKENKALIVVHGECVRDAHHLPISKGCTVIGSGAVISVGQESFNLTIPEAVIRADESAGWASKSDTDKFEWIICRNDPSKMNFLELANDANTVSQFLNAGHFPLVYLNQSSLIGVTLDCKNVTQAIVGSKGKIHVINNKIINSLKHGIFLHDGEFIVKDNKLEGANADQLEFITLTPDETTERMNPILSDYFYMRDGSCNIVAIPPQDQGDRIGCTIM